MNENQIKWVISIKIVSFGFFLYTEINKIKMIVLIRFIFKVNFVENIVYQSYNYAWYKFNSSMHFSFN